MNKKLDFRWSPFKEDIGIFGKKGTGKTTRAKMILDLIPNLPRIIWSPQRPMENYRGYGQEINTLDQLRHGAFIWNGNYDKETFVKFIERVFQMRNLILVIDDVHEYVTKQKMPPIFSAMVLSGRNRGISSIFISPAPNLVHNAILGSCTHIFAYNFNLQSQIEWIRNNFFGDEAWLLIPKDKRNRYYISEKDPDVIAPYSYIYRKDSDSRTQIILTGNSEPVELESLNEELEEDIDSEESIQSDPKSDPNSES